MNDLTRLRQMINQRPRQLSPHTLARLYSHRLRTHPDRPDASVTEMLSWLADHVEKIIQEESK